MVQWLRLCAFSPEGPGLIPHRGTGGSWEEPASKLTQVVGRSQFLVAAALRSFFPAGWELRAALYSYRLPGLLFVCQWCLF